jgi:hypothetical protein
MMKNKAAKGSSFEREICKELSWWWTGGERDDVFWRTSGSGARATTRSKKKLYTHDQHGDVHCCDPVGQIFTKLFCVEIKRGYDFDFYSLFRTPVSLKHPFLQFWMQAEEGQKASGAKWPMLIFKQDRKPILVSVPWSFWPQYIEQHSSEERIKPSIRGFLRSRVITNPLDLDNLSVFELAFISRNYSPQRLSLMNFDTWKFAVCPGQLIRMSANL